MTILSRGTAVPSTRSVAILAVVSLLVWSACGGAGGPATGASPAATASAPAAPPTPDTLLPAPEATPLPVGLAPLVEPFKGDFDGMVQRRLIRVLTVQNPVLYFVDKGREVGLTYEAIKAFEKEVNESLGNKVVMVHVVPIPVARDRLIPDLVAGRGDIAAGAITVTPERRKLVDFSDPFATGVREVLVTGPDTPPVASLDELSGREVYVRPSSSYAEHIRKLNARFKSQGKPPLEITPAPETLEDGDILEMVAGGLVPATVVDDFMADLYTQVFPALRKNSDIASAPGQIAWAYRKNSPKLAAALKGFVAKNKQGSLAANVLINKYVKTTKWVKNARAGDDRKRFESMVALFKKYGDKYDLDSLLMAAQGYQESGLDQSMRSPVGAIGVMQVMPATARDKAVGIPDIENLESNIHAGVKYIRWVEQNFYQDPAITPLNKGLFAFASYNAGPGKVSSLRKEARAQGLDPNKWFNNVELIAAKRIGRETVTYVSNIYKYYLAYQLMQQRGEERKAAKSQAASAPQP
jgi:membrane-bound lytic murein transglycosylase MltF